ncbi:MAG: DUF362 domain-containing protein [Candidatus Poribacteria bacterium]
MEHLKKYSVRAVYCNYKASDEEVYESLCRAIDPLDRAVNKIKKARKIVIKTNMAWDPDHLRYFEGRRQEHVDDSVMRATLRYLRENTNAKIISTDIDAARLPNLRGINYLPILDEFGIEFVNSDEPPFKIYDVPGGGLMFAKYKLSECLADADAFVSVAKMKNHAFMGITLCLKNLFGLPPMLPHNRPRNYYHHIIRLPYVLVDLGLITQPCLNIIDALTGQSHREWGGDPRICNALIAGDHVIATDACGAWLMGYDPKADWSTMPFRRDRNSLLIAEENGFGTVNLDKIDFQTEVERPLADFKPDEPDSQETVTNWRRTTCEQALFYLEHEKELMDQYAGQYIFLQDGEVVFNGTDFRNMGSRRGMTRGRPDHALWLKYIDPEDMEGEKFNVYEENLDRLLLK